MRVVCAVIWQQDKVLLARRPWGKSQGGCWEFPGGKVEGDETDEQALHREIFEELSLVIQIGSALPEVHWRENNRALCLCGYHALAENPRQLHLREHLEYAWLRPTEIQADQLAPADQPLLRHLLDRGMTRF